MDLKTAHSDAAAFTEKNKGKMYIIIDNEGECTLNRAPLKGVAFCYEGGQQIPLPDNFVNKAKEPKAEKKTRKTGVNQQPTIEETVETDEPESENEGTTKNKKKVETKSKSKKAAKKSAPKKAAKKTTERAARNGETRIPRGNNMFLTAAEWKKVDALLDKEEISFSAWSRGLVLAKIK